MKASELRIGNLVEHKHLKGGVLYDYDSITFIVENAISINSAKHVGRTIGSVKPIPLTGEWLLKFDIHTDYIFDNEYKREIDGYLLYIEDIASCNVVNWDKPIKYVHEAQNLYFALTGNELEIKE